MDNGLSLTEMKLSSAGAPVLILIVMDNGLSPEVSPRRVQDAWS